MKKHIITFCDSKHWQSRIDNFIEESQNMGFDSIKVYTEETLDDEFKEVINQRLADTSINNSRGYCFWSWKSHIMKEYMMNEMEEGDILMYLDAGCTLNSNEPALQRMNEIFDNISLEENYLTSVSLEYLPQHSIIENTKPSLIHKFQEVYNLSDSYMDILIQKVCFEAGVIIVKKCHNGINFIKNFELFVNKYYDYISDKIIEEGDALYVENSKHRHDQSVFSLLCNLYNIQPCLNYYQDCYSKNPDNNSYYENYFDKPIWYTRTKTKIAPYIQNKAVAIVYGNDGLTEDLQTTNKFRDIQHYDVVYVDSLEESINGLQQKLKSIYEAFIKLDDDSVLLFFDDDAYINSENVNDTIDTFMNIMNEGHDSIFFYNKNVIHQDVCMKSSIWGVINFSNASYSNIGDDRIKYIFEKNLNIFSVFALKKNKENMQFLKDIMFITNIYTNYLLFDPVWDTDMEWVNTDKLTKNTNVPFSILSERLNSVEIDIEESLIKYNK